MSKFYNNKKVLSFRHYDKLDGDIYQTYELAWPVEVIECYANKVSEGMLDALAQVVLELLDIPEMTRKKVAELLGVSEEVINKIVVDLSNHRLYDKKEQCLTKAGKEYLEKKELGEFQEEKVFGNMFVSRIDGEVFPYFREGKLPWGREMEDILFLSYDGDEPSVLKLKSSGLVDRVNRAFHKFGRISKMSKDQDHSGSDHTEIEFIEEELRDRSYDEPGTLADAEEDKNLKNARVKILDTRPREIYVRCRMYVSKAAPEKFVVESPFPENTTSWYSECFHRMVSNNELVYVEDSETGLEYFCEGITKQFYVDFPEMQANNFEQYVKINFPKMLSCSISAICMDKYREVFKYHILCDEGNIRKDTVVGEAAKAIELILNNYIDKTNKFEVIKKYRDNVQTEEEIRNLIDNYGIKECAASRKEIGKLYKGRVQESQSIIMSGFRGMRMGSSIAEKYYYLIAEATYNPNSKFRKLLKNEGSGFIDQLDEISSFRNKYGAHNDGIKAVVMNQTDYTKFDSYYKNVTRVLLEYID